MNDLGEQSGPRLHIFEQNGGWHWGITVNRSEGFGMKVIAYSSVIFNSEDESRTDGERALVDLQSQTEKVWVRMTQRPRYL